MAEDIKFGITLKLDGKEVKGEIRAASEELAKLGREAEKADRSGRFEQTRAGLADIKTKAGALAGLTVGTLGITALTAAIAQASDAIVSLNARLKLAVNSSEELRATQQGLFDLAQRMQLAYTELGAAFNRIAGSVRELGGTTQQSIQLAEVLSVTARLSGASSAEAAASAQQFSQALASGVLQGDELRSILENNQRLARALAEGLGVGVGELRKMGEEGKLTADVVATALLGQLPKLREEVASIPVTYAGAWERVKNEVTLILSELNQGLGDGAAEAFKAVTTALSVFREAITAANNASREASASVRDKSQAAQELQTVLGALLTPLQAVYGMTQAFGTGLRVISEVIRSLIADFIALAKTAEIVQQALNGQGLTTAAERIRAVWTERNAAVAASFQRVADSAHATNAAVEAFVKGSERALERARALANSQNNESSAERRRLGLDRVSVDAGFGQVSAARRLSGELDKEIKQVSTQVEKLTKEFGEHKEKIAKAKAGLLAAMNSGDEKYRAQAAEQLAKLQAQEAKLVAGFERKIAEARQAEAKKGVSAVNAASQYAASMKAAREALAKAELEQAKVLAENRFALEKAGLERSLQALKAAHDAGLVSTRDYLDQRLALTLDGLAKEQAAIELAAAATAQRLAANRQAQTGAQALAETGATKEIRLKGAQELAKLRDEEVKLLKQAADLSLKLVKIDDERARAVEEIAAARRKALLDEQKQAQALVDQYRAQAQAMERFAETLAEIQRETARVRDDAAFELSLYGKSREEVERLRAARQGQLEIERAMLELKKAQAAYDEIAGDFGEEALKRSQALAVAQERYNAAVANAETRSWAVEQRQELERTTAITNSLADAIVGIATQGSRYFKKLWQDFKMMALRALAEVAAKRIIVGIAGFLGLNQGALAQVTGGQQGGILSSLLGSVTGGSGSPLSSVLSSVGSALSSGISSLFPSLSASLGSFGASLTAGLSANLATLSTAFTAGTAAAGGLAATIGAAIPVIGLFAGAAALVSRLFRKKLKDEGFAATFSGGQVTGEGFRVFSRLFRSDKTEKTPLDPQLAKVLNETTQGIIASMRGFAEALGLSSKALDELTFNFRLSTKGLKPEEIEAKLKEQFAAFGKAAAGAVFEGSGFERAVNEFKGSLEELQQFLAGYTRLILAVKEASAAIPILTNAIYALSKAPKEVQEAFIGIAGYLSPKITEQFRAQFQALNGAFSSIARPAPSLLAQWRALGEQIRGWADLSQQGVVRLAELVRQRYQAEESLVRSIIELARSAAQEFGAAGEAFFLDSLDLAGKIDFFDRRGEEARARLATATDPAEIEALTKELLRAAREGYNLQRQVLEQQAQRALSGLDSDSPQARAIRDRLEADLRELAARYAVISGQDNTLVQQALGRVVDTVLVDRDAKSPASVAAELAAKTAEAAERLMAAVEKFSGAAANLRGQVEVNVNVNDQPSTTTWAELVPARDYA